MEIVDRSFRRFSYYYTSVFSIFLRKHGWNHLINRLIADCTAVEERNKCLAVLEAVISAATVVGPAIGSVLSRHSYSLPLIFAGIFAGIALIFAFFFLEETNKDVFELKQMKKKMKTNLKKGRFSFIHSFIHTIYCVLLDRGEGGIKSPNCIKEKGNHSKSSSHQSQANIIDDLLFYC